MTRPATQMDTGRNMQTLETEIETLTSSVLKTKDDKPTTFLDNLFLILKEVIKRQ